MADFSLEAPQGKDRGRLLRVCPGRCELRVLLPGAVQFGVKVRTFSDSQKLKEFITNR